MAAAHPHTVWLRKIHIDGFGHFHDVELTLTPGLNVLHGQNEAGKSTLFAFIRAMLFGFSSRKPGHNRYQPKAGGAMGGRLVLATPEGDLVVSRVLRKKVDGDLTLTNARGEELPAARLVQALGNMSRELFEQVFSLTLDDLRDFERLSKDDTVATALFVSGVPGARRVPAAVTALTDEAEALFKPKGAKPLNEALSRLKEVQRKVSEIGERPREYAQARQAREALESRLPELEIQKRKAEGHRQKLELLLKLKPELEAALFAQLALADLGPTLPFDPAAVERLERLLEEETKAGRELADREREKSQIIAARAALEGALWAADPMAKVGQALRAATRLQELADKLPARRARLENEQRQWRSDVAGLGFGVEGVTATAVARAGLTELKEQREKIDEQRVRAEETERGVKAERDTALLGVASAEDRLKASREVDLESVERAIDALGLLSALQQQLTAQKQRRDLLKSEALKAGAATDEGAKGRATAPWGWAGVALLLLAPLVAALARPSWLLIIAAGTLPMAALLAYLLYRRNGGASAAGEAHGGSERLIEAQAQLEQHVERYAQQRAACGLRPDESIENRRAQLVSDRHAAQQRADCQRELASWRQRVAHAEERCRAAALELAAQDKRASEFAALVEGRLQAAGLPQRVSPAAALELLDQVSLLQRRAAQTAAEQAALNDDAQRWLTVVTAVRAAAQGVGQTAPEEESTLLALISERWAEQEKKVALRSGLDEKLAALENPWANASARATAAGSALSALLANSQCENAAAFRVEAGKAQRAAELREELNAVTARVKLAMGMDLERARAQLVEAEPLGESVASAVTAVDRHAQALKAAEQERVELRLKLSQWENDGELRALREEEERLHAQVADYARRVTTAHMAASMLSKAMQDFEQHHQPRLLLRATEVFARLTQGRYTRLFMEGGSASNLRATDQQGQHWGAAELSRGTQDQLFLAFRVAVAEEVGARQHRLPLMIDDVMVNFDEQRGQAAVQMVADLAKSHQTVVFSCQATTRRWLEEAGAHSVAVTSQKQLRLLSVDANG
jgi:uncharacterized protein YhaN